MQQLRKRLVVGKQVISISLLVTLTGTLIRLTGILQPLDWAVLDNSFQLRKLEPPDNRFLIVAVEEADLKHLKQWPTSDENLAMVLNNIKQQKPAVIGLDIYRDFPVEPGAKELSKVFESTPNLLGIQKIINAPYSASIAPPSVLAKQGQIANNDIIVDGDGVIRRGILYPKTSGDNALPSLGLEAAAIYLEKSQGIVAESGEKGNLKLGKTVFVPFENSDGGYVSADAGGYQILLNYRGPAESFPHVSFTDALNNRVKPELIRNRIVLIGAYAPSLNDRFYTPYSRKLIGTTPIRTPGVEIQANLASQIIAAVLDNRPLIKVLPFPLSEIWLFLWTVVTCSLIYRWGNKSNLTFLAIITTPVLITGCWWVSQNAFLKGWWIPSVPPILGIIVSAFVCLGYIYLTKLKETVSSLNNQVQENKVLYAQLSDYSRNLETKVEERTRELLVLEKELLIREKMAALGSLVAGVAHEINTPIHNSVLAASTLATETRSLLESHQNQRIKRSQLESFIDTASESSRIIVSNLSRAAELIQSFKQVAVDTSSSPLREFNVLGYIEDTLLNLKPKLKPSKHRVEIIGDSTISMHSYPGDLAQICTNLVMNSLVHAYDDGVTGRLAFEFKLDGDCPRGSAEGNRVLLTYSDDGKGIPPENLDKIFDPFFTTARGQGGSGLGLNIVYNIVTQKLRGSITVESEVGQGTKFILNLPQNLRNQES